MFGLIVDVNLAGRRVRSEQPLRSRAGVDQSDAADFLLDAAETRRVDQRRDIVGLWLGIEAPDADGLFRHIKVAGAVVRYAMFRGRRNVKAPDLTPQNTAVAIGKKKVLVDFTTVAHGEGV